MFCSYLFFYIFLLYSCLYWTSKGEVKLLIVGIQQVFTSYSNPKGNANTERWFRTLKEDCIWLNEWLN